ncbi:malic enzyme-like NAD(P)-binding protein [Shigella flexneri]
MTASQAAGGQVEREKIVFLRAGSAGCGIAEIIVARPRREGLSEEAARQKVFIVEWLWLVD